MSEDDLVEAVNRWAIEAASRNFGSGFLRVAPGVFDPATDGMSFTVTWTPACRCGHQPHGTSRCPVCECPWSFQEVPPEARPKGYVTVADMQAGGVEP